MEKQYYVIRRSDNSLSHAQKGKERENHKYIKREWKNGRYQYWYKDDQGNLTTNKSAASNSAKDNLSKLPTSVANKLTGNDKAAKNYKLDDTKKSNVIFDNGRTFHNITATIDDPNEKVDDKKTESDFDQLISKGKESLSNLFSKVTSNVEEVISKGKDFLYKAAESIDKKYNAYQWKKDTKNNLDKLPSDVANKITGKDKAAKNYKIDDSSMAKGVGAAGGMTDAKQPYDDYQRKKSYEKSVKNNLDKIPGNTANRITGKDKAAEKHQLDDVNKQWEAQMQAEKDSYNRAKNNKKRQETQAAAKQQKQLDDLNKQWEAQMQAEKDSYNRAKNDNQSSGGLRRETKQEKDAREQAARAANDNQSSGGLRRETKQEKDAREAQQLDELNKQWEAQMQAEKDAYNRAKNNEKRQKRQAAEQAESKMHKEWEQQYNQAKSEQEQAARAANNNKRRETQQKKKREEEQKKRNQEILDMLKVELPAVKRR